MIKFLPIVVLILLVVGASWFLINRQQQNPNKSTQTAQQEIAATANNPIAALTNGTSTGNDQYKTLSDAITAISKKLNGETATSIATLESKVSSLEDKVTTLQRQVSQLQTSSGISPTPTEAATTTKKSPIYIPLGWVSSQTTLDWTTDSTQSVVIDTADYPGMTSAQFEGRIVNYQGNGTCYARMINITDGLALLGSLISVSATDYTWVTSSGFSLTTGKKTYAVQLKTNTGYAAQISDAHLKINF
ncbi:MAG: hypothetical protein WCV81_05795 [Microgenomates group bacterium]|jgi:hypothetical protein